LLQTLLSSLRKDTKLCVALDLTMPSQEVIVGSILWWQKQNKNINKRPAVFLIASK